MSRVIHQSIVKRAVSLVAIAVLLSGCAMFSEDRSFDVVRSETGARIGAEAYAQVNDDDAMNTAARVKVLLSKPLTANSAVAAALLNNRELQASYNALGVAEARRVRASLPDNPVFSFSNISGGGGFEVERQVAVGILSLATLPARADIANDRYRQAQWQAVAETMRVALEARRAWINAVAARASATFLSQAQETAKNANELNKRLGETGAINKLDQARNQVFYAELTAQLGAARQRVETTRERLVRILGVWGDDLAFRLPADFPALPKRPRAMAEVEKEAVARRIDLEMARIDLAVLRKSYGLTNATRFVNLFDVSGISRRLQEPGSGDTANQLGLSVQMEIPIFDLGETKVREAEQLYMQAANRLFAKAVSVRSEAREAYQVYRASYDIARHYQSEVLPLRKVISDETLLRYNAMQVDVFSLLAEARARILSTTAAIDASRDYRLAEAGLAAAVVGGTAVITESSSSQSVAEAAPNGGH